MHIEWPLQALSRPVPNVLPLAIRSDDTDQQPDASSASRRNWANGLDDAIGTGAGLLALTINMHPMSVKGLEDWRVAVADKVQVCGSGRLHCKRHPRWHDEQVAAFDVPRTLANRSGAGSVEDLEDRRANLSAYKRLTAGADAVHLGSDRRHYVSAAAWVREAHRGVARAERDRMPFFL
jgi:hypothetical protein